LERHDGSIDGFIEEEEGINGNNMYQCLDTIEVRGMSSADMWNECATESKRGYHKEIALALPSTLIPWKRDDKIEKYTIGSSSSSLTTSIPLTSHEWIKFGIISNPPTLLSIQTFENFTPHLFTSVPIVLRTNVLYATHTVISWFVDKEMVLQDSHMYTPTVRDIGKRISVLVTPMRPGNHGDGFQEAYSFTRLVELLPTMPIVQMREKWIRRKCVDCVAVGNDDGKNRLRVLTVSLINCGSLQFDNKYNSLAFCLYKFNILADLYAGREIDQHYSHCDARHLLRRRRMPVSPMERNIALFYHLVLHVL
jgi:hypothetical protein